MLERIIFRGIFLEERYRRILFVGCAPYTGWYPLLLERFPPIRFETLDADPENRRYGCPRHHRVGRLEELAGGPGAPEPYDLVILNGLFGYGTDDPQAIHRALDAAGQAVRPGGTLLIGFNDLAGPARFDPGWIPRDRFEPAPIPGMAVHDFLAEGSHRHRFVSFRKTAGPGASK